MVLPAVEGLGARSGSLVASAVVFFVPSLLLAMVSPLGVRLVAARGVEHIGRSAGSLYAISTAGSIAGTLLTAFWLIPLMGLDPLVIGIAALLFVAASLATTLPARYEEFAVDDSASAKHARLARWVTLGAMVAGVAVASPRSEYRRPVQWPAERRARASGYCSARTPSTTASR